MKNLLVFETMGNAVVTINLDKCQECESKACVEACSKPHMGSILGLNKEGKPELVQDVKRVRKGACTDCLACELDCELYGNQAITITLEMPELDKHLDDIKEKGEKVVYCK